MTVAARKLRPLILICDDELPLRELIKAALGDTYRYVEAGDVREAEDALSSEEPVAIVLDVMLPGKSGIDFLTDLRTASTPSESRSWSYRHGRAPTTSSCADGRRQTRFIGKPFDPEDLATLVEGLVAA